MTDEHGEEPSVCSDCDQEYSSGIHWCSNLDRLAEIEKYGFNQPIGGDDLQWLINEVKRLMGRDELYAKLKAKIAEFYGGDGGYAILHRRATCIGRSPQLTAILARQYPVRFGHFNLEGSIGGNGPHGMMLCPVFIG